MGANSGGTGKIENKTQDEDKQNKKVELGLEKDKQILLLIEIYSVSAETMINDAFSYSENV